MNTLKMIRKGVLLSSPIDYTAPSTQFTFDVNKNTFFEKDDENYINELGVQQLNTLKNVSILDIHLSCDNVVEPHYHQDAAELIYCLSGSITVSVLNPFTKNLTDYPLTSGQVVNIPRGWWHYIVATTKNAHFLGIFDQPTPEVILGSDLLTLTPPNIIAHTYCVNESQWRNTIAPIQPSTFIGPPTDCQNSIESCNCQSTSPMYYQMNRYMHPYPCLPYSYY